jgi:flagellar protein FliS
MLAHYDPREAYRRVGFDAVVSSAGPEQLVSLCFDQLIEALGSALSAHDRADNSRKSQALTRALSALTALQMGVSSEVGVGVALSHLYEASRRSLLNNVISFDAEAIAAMRQDFHDIARAISAAH